jgi:hypothetical protein
VTVDNLYVEFKTKDAHGKERVQAHKVVYVLLDLRYFQGNELRSREGKFDVAYLILGGIPKGIHPARLFTNAQLPNDSLMTVVTYGTADRLIPEFSPLRRAFRLYERDTYFGGGKDPEAIKKSRYLQESSLYFKPSTHATRPAETDDEEEVRAFDATQLWHRDGHKPYGLALPGTSGAPVFVHVKKDGFESLYLFALVSSFSHLSGVFKSARSGDEADYILGHKGESLNQYQTIYSLLYKNVALSVPVSNQKSYMLDPVVISLLATANHVADQTPFYRTHMAHMTGFFEAMRDKIAKLFS